MNRGYINRILPFSSVDGPGNRTAIFLQGCNLNCWYCHNPETIKNCTHCGECIETCPAGALVSTDGRVKWNQDICSHCHQCLNTCRYDSSPRVNSMTVEDVLEELKKTRPFISGITVSGGECTLQIPFLIGLFKEVRKMGLSIFIDTNGSVPLEQEEEFIALVDMFMVDLKSIESEEHKALTGLNCDVVVDNIKFLAKINKLYEVRTVIVPDVLDNKRNVEKISLLLGSLNPTIKYKLIKYRALGVREGFISSASPKDEYMEELKKLAKDSGCSDVVII